MNISKSLYDEFMRKWRNGDFPHQRLGQAFYNHFKLHKSNNVPNDGKLYNADNETAEKLISAMIDWDN